MIRKIDQEKWDALAKRIGAPKAGAVADVRKRVGPTMALRLLCEMAKIDRAEALEDFIGERGLEDAVFAFVLDSYLAEHE